MKFTTMMFSTLFLLSSCAEHLKPRRTLASFPDLPAPELGESWSSENVVQAEYILDEMSKSIAKREADPNYTSRDAHPKAHGCTAAVFTTDISGLPKEHQVGVFEKNASYNAWVRFSNGAPSGGPDLNKDVRGMAVKLMNIPKTKRGSQDFVMINAKEFFSKDGDDYGALFKALLSENRRDIVFYGIKHPMSVARLLSAQIKIGNPLAISYHSSTIYKLGTKSMRFKMEPCSALPNNIPDKAEDHFLRKILSESVASNEACFNFYVQPNQNPRQQPVEDPRVEWNVKTSSYIKIAQLKILKQDNVASKVQRDFCENLAFDPWNTRMETRPLGQINRMRSLIYGEIAKQRHQENQTVVMEPKTHKPCEGETSILCKDPRK